MFLYEIVLFYFHGNNCVDFTLAVAPSECQHRDPHAEQRVRGVGMSYDVA